MPRRLPCAHTPANANADADADAIAFAPALAIALAPAIAGAGAFAHAPALANVNANVSAPTLAIANATNRRRTNVTINVALRFAKGYIAHPYWPARERVISIQKTSGINRVRNEKKRAEALKAYLGTVGMTLEQYEMLVQDASRPFYTHASGEILVPAHQLHGLMAQAADLAPSAVRLATNEQVRTFLTWEDLRTGKMKADGVWDRFVIVKSGTGQTLSNQRGLRSDPYIEDFAATGALWLVNPETEPKARQFIEWAGHEIGVGAARKMGWGRFTLASWNKREDER